MRAFDFSSWQSIATTFFGLALVTLIGVGIRLLVMMTIQQRRERLNRQINERLRTLIAAYKALGGSFTGNLMVDPRHLRDIRRGVGRDMDVAIDLSGSGEKETGSEESDRPRRIRDAVEAALSDIILLGTAEQVRLAAAAALDLASGRPVHVHELVIALRDYIREALDLDPVPADIAIPVQGPTRPSGAGGKGGSAGRVGSGGGGGGRGGGSGGGMGMAGGMGLAGGIGLAHGASDEDVDPAAGQPKS